MKQAVEMQAELFVRLEELSQEEDEGLVFAGLLYGVKAHLDRATKYRALREAEDRK